MSNDAPVIYLNRIERHYRQGDDRLDILKGAELAVWPGQSVALIAPSGAGKSTLLHIAGLLEHQDAGEVFINETATSGLSDAARTRLRRIEIGFVYQFQSSARASFSAISGSRNGSAIARANYRGASSNASRSRGRWPMRRTFSWPTSPPEISIRARPSGFSRRSPNWSAHPASLPSSRPTTWTSQPAWTGA